MGYEGQELLLGSESGVWMMVMGGVVAAVVEEEAELRLESLEWVDS